LWIADCGLRIEDGVIGTKRFRHLVHLRLPWGVAGWACLVGGLGPRVWALWFRVSLRTCLLGLENEVGMPQDHVGLPRRIRRTAFAAAAHVLSRSDLGRESKESHHGPLYRSEG
jgi:hypothetical protein